MLPRLCFRSQPLGLGSRGRRRLPAAVWRTVGCLALAALSERPAPAAAIALSGDPRPPPTVASYTLTARLHPARWAIDGRGTIRFRNLSPVPLRRISFHLYLNGFRDSRSVFLSSPGARELGRPERSGFIDLTYLRSPEQGDLLARLVAERPEHPGDLTAPYVELATPLAPGQTLELELGWKSQLPSLVTRTGISRDFVFAGQWYPKLAKLNMDGSFEDFAFHSLAEFYSDFGDYEVTLDVPESYVTGATGTTTAQSIDDGRKRVTYRSEFVHDFAWSAWPGFIEKNETIAGTRCRLLYPPGHEHNAELTLRTLRAALPEFELRMGSYPYPQLTIVHPPHFASGAGGMEYPTLITTGGHWLWGWATGKVQTVTVHELGHQWLYGIVASNEARHPVLDEGLNSYLEQRVVAQEAISRTVPRPWRWLPTGPADRSLLHGRWPRAPLGGPAQDFRSFQHLAQVVYGRAPLLLTSLARIYGQDRVDAALLQFASEHRFKHPRPEDWLQALGNSVGPAAKEAFAQALSDGAYVDYAVEQADCTPPRSAGRNWACRVAVTRDGPISLPVEISLHFSEEPPRLEQWNGKGTTHILEVSSPSPLVSARVDPKRHIALDQDLLNNQRRPSATRPLLREFGSACLAWLLAMAEL